MRGRRALWLSLGACLCSFVVVAAAVRDRLAYVDLGAAYVAQTWRTPALTTVFQTVTWFGSGWWLASVSAVSAWLFARRRRSVAAWAAVAGPAGAWGVTAWLKAVFARDRPAFPWLPPLTEASGFSFPSGHALGSTAVYGLLLLLVWPEAPLRLRRGLAGAVAVLVLAIGLSRIYLGVHYASDVIAGWLVGVASLCCWQLAWQRLAQPAQRVNRSHARRRGR